MKFLSFCLVFFVLFSCKETQKKSNATNIVPVTKTDLLVEYSPVYFSENVKSDIKGWNEFILFQNKIYELKNTNTVRLQSQLNDLDALVSNLYTVSTPKKLQEFSFENKVRLLEIAIIEFNQSIENLSVEEKKAGISTIFQVFNSLKNQINALYA